MKGSFYKRHHTLTITLIALAILLVPAILVIAGVLTYNKIAGSSSGGELTLIPELTIQGVPMYRNMRLFEFLDTDFGKSIDWNFSIEKDTNKIEVDDSQSLAEAIKEYEPDVVCLFSKGEDYSFRFIDEELQLVRVEGGSFEIDGITENSSLQDIADEWGSYSIKIGMNNLTYDVYGGNIIFAKLPDQDKIGITYILPLEVLMNEKQE